MIFRNRRRLLPALLVIAVALPALASCAQSTVVSRRDVAETIDLSGSWNDVDSRQVSEEMISSSLSSPWIDEWMSASGQRPVIITYGVRNRSSEHINTRTFMKDLERALLRSGRVRVVADPGERLKTRGERAEQQVGLTANPALVGKELGADFVLTGELNSIVDREGGTKVVFYQIDLELINVETNEKVWIGDKKLKKLLERSRFKS